jgi:hypothetical protein
MTGSHIYLLSIWFELRAATTFPLPSLTFDALRVQVQRIVADKIIA